MTLVEQVTCPVAGQLCLLVCWCLHAGTVGHLQHVQSVWLILRQDDFTVHSASGKLGGFQGAALPWLIGMCAYTMTPAHHEVLVVEDMAADARFNFM